MSEFQEAPRKAIAKIHAHMGGGKYKTHAAFRSAFDAAVSEIMGGPLVPVTRTAEYVSGVYRGDRNEFASESRAYWQECANAGPCWHEMEENGSATLPHGVIWHDDIGRIQARFTDEHGGQRDFRISIDANSPQKLVLEEYTIPDAEE